VPRALEGQAGLPAGEVLFSKVERETSKLSMQGMRDPTLAAKTAIEAQSSTPPGA
jgi:hypothetical protein